MLCPPNSSLAMNTSDITIECYARAATMSGPVNETIETLQAYDQQDVIETLTVDVWPDEVVLTAETKETALIEQYRRFQTWAEQTDVSLQPAFLIRERATIVSDQPKRALVLPMVCLAIHADGELTTVVPHQTDTTTYTVEDALADLTAPDRTIPTSHMDAPGDPPTPST